MALPFQLDAGAAANAAFGLVVLQTDETIETELTPLFANSGFGLYHARLPSAVDVNAETLQQMENDLPKAISLLPKERGLDVVGYACTSGATLIGHENIAQMVRAQHPTASTTDPMTAVIAALRHMSAKNIAVITPYVPAVTQKMHAHLLSNGFHIPEIGSFEQTKEATVARITESSLLAAIVDIGAQKNVDAVFASCTNLRSFNILEEAEKQINKPVISSNQALAWHMLKLAKVAPKQMGPGRLFSS